MPDSVQRPATNWPASVRDYLNIASYYRRVAERKGAHTAAVERASRLAAAFEELADTAAGSAQPVAAVPEPVFRPHADPAAAGPSAARIGRWPAWAMAGLAACLAAVPFLRVTRSTSPLLTLAGVVTDSLCGQYHTTVPDAACVNSCVSRGAKYAFYDGTSLYTLSDQRLGKRFAAQKVDVSGTLDRAAGILHVNTIRAAS